MSAFLPFLKQSGHLDPVQMTICNVGSRKLSENDDYASQGWHIFAPNLAIYGFDADADACEAANADLEARQINWVERHIPLALGRIEGELTLHVTNQPMCSSLYPPNESYCKRFALPGLEKYKLPCPRLSEFMDLDFVIEVEIITLDKVYKILDIGEVDFLQIDVQGAELQVLEGATQVLSQGVLAIQVEVEFSHLYLDQPLFADVDTYLRNQGFTLFDLHLNHLLRCRSPIRSNAHPGQILWGDAYYLRDPINQSCVAAFREPNRILKLACIADVLNFSDYALELFEYLTMHYGDNPKYNCADSIIQGLAVFPDVVKSGLGNLEVIANIREFASDDILRCYNCF